MHHITTLLRLDFYGAATEVEAEIGYERLGAGEVEVTRVSASGVNLTPVLPNDAINALELLVMEREREEAGEVAA